MPRSKKPSGKRSAGAREVVYRRPYWFDRTRSLAELHGWPRSDASDGLGLVGRHGVAIARPVGQLDAEDLAKESDPIGVLAEEVFGDLEDFLILFRSLGKHG